MRAVTAYMIKDEYNSMLKNNHKFYKRINQYCLYKKIFYQNIISINTNILSFIIFKYTIIIT